MSRTPTLAPIVGRRSTTSRVIASGRTALLAWPTATVRRREHGRRGFAAMVPEEYREISREGAWPPKAAGPGIR